MEDRVMAAFVVGAIVAGGISAGVTALTASAAAIAAGAISSAFMTTFVTSLVLGGISKALAKSPSAPGAGGAGAFQAQGRLVTIRQPITPWQVIVGQARVAGALTFYWESADREYVHMVITFACHRCESIDQIFFDEHLVALDANGEAFGRWSFVETDQELTNLLQVIPPSGQITVSGFGLLHSVGIQHLVPFSTDVSPGQPATYAQFSRVGNVFTFHSSAVGTVASINYYAQSTTESSVRVKKSLGDEASNVQPFPDLVAETGGVWSNDHKQYGHCKIYVRLRANPVAFPNGIPNITAVIRGARIYDPRTGSTAFSQNAALWISHYLTESASPYGFGAVYADEIDEDDLIAAANTSEEQFTRASGGVELRYEVNGAFTTSEKPKDVLSRLLAACGGSLVNLGGKWHINVAAYNAPTVTLDEDDLAGPSMVNPHLPAQDFCNGVKGVYTNRDKGWQADDFPPVSSTSALEEDNNERNWKDIDLTAFVVSSGQAQRLAKIDLLRNRQALTEVALFKLPAWQCVPGKTVARTDAQYGWTAKVFEVVECELAVADGGGAPTLAVQLTLRETASAVYDFATNEDAQGDIAPNTTLPNPGIVPPPGTPSISEENYETRDGRAVATKAIVTYAQSVYPFGASYQLEYKRTSASTYTVQPLITPASDNGSAIVQEILDVGPGTYNFRVKAIGVGGRQSAYSGVTTAEIIGLSAPPSTPVIRGLQASGDGTTCILTLEPATDADVRIGGRWIVRHTDGDTPVWSQALSIGNSDGYPGGVNIITLPLKPGTYLVKAQDALGQLSADFDSIFVKQASVLAFSNVATLTEDSTFPGQKDSVVALDGLLKLSGAGLFDSITDLDAISDLDGYGGLAASGTYYFNSRFNFGAITNVRITTQIVGQEINVNDLIDDWDDDVDVRADWDGDTGMEGAATDAWVEIRESDTDPTVSPTPAFNDWKRVDTAAFRCWGAELRLRMTSVDAAYNRHINQLRAVAEEI
jgi:hypothetical protein